MDEKEEGYSKDEIKSCVDSFIKVDEVNADSDKLAVVNKELQKRKKSNITDLASLKEYANAYKDGYDHEEKEKDDSEESEE